MESFLCRISPRDPIIYFCYAYGDIPPPRTLPSLNVCDCVEKKGIVLHHIIIHYGQKSHKTSSKVDHECSSYMTRQLDNSAVTRKAYLPPLAPKTPSSPRRSQHSPVLRVQTPARAE